MKTLIAYDCRSQYYTIKQIDLNYIRENIDILHFNSILLDPSVVIEEGLLLFTDKDRPISTRVDYVYKNYLAINGEYFKEHKDEVMDVVNEYSKKGGTTFLNISSELVNDEIINNIKNNKKIEMFKVNKK